MEPIRVTVHPFVRSDGEDRTKHTTTLAAALEEMREDVREGAIIIPAQEVWIATEGWVRDDQVGSGLASDR